MSKLPTPHNTLIWAFWVAKPIFVRTLVGPMSLTTTGGYKIFCTLVEGINPN